MKLETKLNELLPAGDSFNVQFYELTRNYGEGWSVNTAWRAATNASRAETLRLLRARWEVFKLNYAPKARVADLSDTSDEAAVCDFEVDCIAFAGVCCCGA